MNAGKVFNPILVVGDSGSATWSLGPRYWVTRVPLLGHPASLLGHSAPATWSLGPRNLAKVFKPNDWCIIFVGKMFRLPHSTNPDNSDDNASAENLFKIS